MTQADDPRTWQGSTPLIDLEDPKLRLRVQSLTQLCKTPREKILALYAYVKRIEYAKPFKMRLHTAREALQQPQADASDKATLLVALLRIAGFPARMRYLTLDREVMRGWLAVPPEPTRPVVEVYSGGWMATDTYIFDAGYIAAARQRLRANGWTHGFGIHADAPALWDGQGNAYLGACAPAEDPMVVREHGCFCDPLEFVSSPSYRQHHARLVRALRWNVHAPAIERAIRDLRQGALEPAACAEPVTSGEPP